MPSYREYLCRGDDFDAVSAIFRYCNFGASDPEAIKKIARDEKLDQKFSQCVLICIAAVLLVEIVGYQDTSSKAKKSLQKFFKFVQEKMQ